MYMLDTCAFIWFVKKSPVFSLEAKKIIFDSGSVCISYVTLWEIAIKQAKGKLNEITASTFELADMCRKSGFKITPLKLTYLERIKKLPFIHHDPFDRIIIATAIEEGYTLITSDKNIQQYPGLKTLW